MKRILTIVAVIASFVIPSNAIAEIINDFSGSYFCTADAAGGIRYNDSADKWEGAIFNEEDRYILKVKISGEVMKDDLVGVVNTYSISFLKHGAEETSNFVGNCFTKIAKKISELSDNGSIHIRENGSFSCKMIGGDLEVNLSNGRFLRSYVWGYVDGEDNNNNTPYIEIGKCSRID